MTGQRLEQLLRGVARGEVSIETALADLRTLPFENLGFARVDHHRGLRQPLAEVIFGAGKTTAEIVAITQALVAQGNNVLCTRCDASVHAALRQALAADAGELRYHDRARALTLIKKPATHVGSVGIVAAGTADLAAAEEARISAEFMGLTATAYYDVGVAGLHRLLETLPALRQQDVLIVAAGMEGALPSVVGGLVAMPVIALPTSIGYGASFSGLAALLAMLNSCASGITVVNIDNGFGAAAAALRMRHVRT